MKQIKVNGCWDCGIGKRDECELVIFNYIVSKTIHPDCPLDDLGDKQTIAMDWEQKYSELKLVTESLIKTEKLIKQQALQNVLAVWDKYYDTWAINLNTEDPKAFQTQLWQAIKSDLLKAGLICEHGKKIDDYCGPCGRVKE